jgi:hypothetical protein
MKLWADWLADNPRDHARCSGLTHTHKSDDEVYVFIKIPLTKAAQAHQSMLIDLYAVLES